MLHWWDLHSGREYRQKALKYLIHQMVIRAEKKYKAARRTNNRH